MTTQQTKATCRFCGKTYAKGGMIHHLATCQARQDADAQREGEPQKLFHLRVQGRHDPQYWMHIEIPAGQTLGELDDFLRTTWLECCGHLSAFTIAGREYSDDDGGMMMPFMPGMDINALIEEEFTEENDPDDEDLDVDAMKADMVTMFKSMGVGDAAIQGFMDDLDSIEDDSPGEGEEYSDDDFDDMMDKMTGSLMKALGLSDNPILGALMKMGPGGLGGAGAPPPGSMATTLDEVLKPGLEFRHEYDFGSTTELDLKVIAEREGKVDLDDPVTILAQNEPPELTCSTCGKKAAVAICTDCLWSESGGLLCEDCLRTHPCGWEMALPVVNSPRMGVCGYDGGELLEFDWMLDDD
jgi:hypothetical protein